MATYGLVGTLPTPAPEISAWDDVAPAPATVTPPATPGAMTTDQQSAYDMLRAMFTQYGLPVDGDIMDVLKAGAIGGDSADIIQVRLQDTQTWKTRFAGNEKRRAAGLNVLSVADYLAQENQYATIMRNAGVPAGFYDDPSDFSNYIGGSISPAEVQDRVNLATDVINREDPAVANELARRGLTQGQLLAYALDPTRAAPLIKRDLNSTLIGAAATRAGINVGVSYADSLANRGVAEAQASQGFGQAADYANNATKLGNIYGVDYDQSDALSEVFDYDQESGDRRKRIAGAERSNFSGSSQYGVSKSSTAGSF